MTATKKTKAITVPSEILQLRHLKKRFSDPAQSEDWLADNFDKMVGSRDPAVPPESSTASETLSRHIEAGL